MKKREREAKQLNEATLLAVDDSDADLAASKDGLKKRNLVAGADAAGVDGAGSADGKSADGSPKKGELATVDGDEKTALKSTKIDEDDDEAPPNDWLAISFNFAQFSLAGSSLFFLVDARSVPQEWVTAMTLMAVVCAMSFLNYIYMHDIWATKGVLLSSIRYMDWFITVPLQIMEFWIVTYIINPEVSFAL